MAFFFLSLFLMGCCFGGVLLWSCRVFATSNFVRYAIQSEIILGACSSKVSKLLHLIWGWITYPIQISLHGFYYFKSDFQASILILRTFFMYNFCFIVQWDYSLPGFHQDALQVVMCWPMMVQSVSLPSSILTSSVEFCVICLVLNVGHDGVGCCFDVCCDTRLIRVLAGSA